MISCLSPQTQMFVADAVPKESADLPRKSIFQSAVIFAEKQTQTSDTKQCILFCSSILAMDTKQCVLFCSSILAMDAKQCVLFCSNILAMDTE